MVVLVAAYYFYFGFCYFGKGNICCEHLRKQAV